MIHLPQTKKSLLNKFKSTSSFIFWLSMHQYFQLPEVSSNPTKNCLPSKYVKMFPQHVNNKISNIQHFLNIANVKWVKIIWRNLLANFTLICTPNPQKVEECFKLMEILFYLNFIPYFPVLSVCGVQDLSQRSFIWLIYKRYGCLMFYWGNKKRVIENHK